MTTLNLSSASFPQGFVGLCANVGLKQKGHDCLLIAASTPAKSTAVFTQSLFAGPSVTLSRQSLQQGVAFQGLVVLSKNANVATGQVGRDNALELQQLAANILNLPAAAVLVASTGIIGKPYPMAQIRTAFTGFMDKIGPLDPAAAASAIMTTDTCYKVSETTCGASRILGIAKGVGMIEPNMATMLTFFFTDADLSQAALERSFKAVVAKTFNALSVDSDTSTSDTAALFANGLAGAVDEAEFTASLEVCATALVKQIALDGEGATKMIVAHVTGARDDQQAKRVAKSIINSPLVKTAVHGADPNWGRVAMAIGKLHEETDIDPEQVQIAFGEHEVYPVQRNSSQSEAAQAQTLQALAAYLAQAEINIHVNLNIGIGQFKAYGCDLSEGYVRINADYTT